MDENLETVLQQARSWPEDDRAELLEVAREIQARRTGVYALSAEERAAIAEGLEDARAGRVIEGAELEAFWARMKA